MDLLKLLLLTGVSLSAAADDLLLQLSGGTRPHVHLTITRAPAAAATR